jgi:hypothetical protein
LSRNHGRLKVLSADCRDHLIQLTRLADCYADRKADFADLCLVRMSELFPRHMALTIDQTDFRAAPHAHRVTDHQAA